MSDDKHAPELPRRQFLQISIGVGAAAALAGAAPAAAKTVAGPASAAAKTRVATTLHCGDPSDSDPLWQKAQHCGTSGTKDPECLVVEPEPAPGPPKITAVYAVVHGAPVNTHNYLLLPTQRISGIECENLWRDIPPYSEYWEHAWHEATDSKSKGYVHLNPAEEQVGLGVNSVHARMMNQLHIHMARISVKHVIDHLDTIGGFPQNWPPKIVEIYGTDQKTGMEASRLYRVLLVSSLKNLFGFMHEYLEILKKAKKSEGEMADQTMIVTQSPRHTKHYYFLSSSEQVVIHPGKRGTNTCDYLLHYGT